MDFLKSCRSSALSASARTKLLRGCAGLLAEKAREVRWIGECEVVGDLVDRRPGKYKLALRLGQNPLADEMSGGDAGRPLDVIVEPVRGHGQLVGVEAEQSFL